MRSAPAAMVILALGLQGCSVSQDTGFAREWTYVSETSAVVYWTLPDISREARSVVRYGPTRDLGGEAKYPEPWWAQLHRLTGLIPKTTYFYRMVNIDEDGNETVSDLRSFRTELKEGAIRLPRDFPGPPFVLDQEGATYVLTEDITAVGTAFEITAPNVTLDLDGHNVLFGTYTDAQARGIHVACDGPATVCNGVVQQGDRSGDYSAAVESRWRKHPTEIFGIATGVHARCAYPIKFLGAAAGVEVHHNRLFSAVTEIESRHYPGNDLLRLDVDGGDCEVHDNILIEGCHVGIRVGGKGPNVSVHHNDISHHQQYVNGYAIAASLPGAVIADNRITSVGRGIHVTGDGLEVRGNWLDLKGHQHLDDMPAKSRPWQHRQVELHGIKLEGKGVRNCRIHGNTVRITQPLPTEQTGEGFGWSKRQNGVYVWSTADGMTADTLTDDGQAWEPDRWKGYWVRYSAEHPPVEITGNDATTLRGEFEEAEPGDYAVFQKWAWVPATPLNVACYEPDAMNEIFGNTFIALTEYSKTRHGA